MENYLYTFDLRVAGWKPENEEYRFAGIYRIVDRIYHILKEGKR